MSLFQKFIIGIKQRFYKLNIVHGLYFLPIGIAALWATFYALQHVIFFFALGGSLFFTIEGLRLIISNPIKTDMAKDIQKSKNWLDKGQSFAARTIGSVNKLNADAEVILSTQVPTTSGSSEMIVPTTTPAPSSHPVG